MKAIETYYKGYHFRSRLEARWAKYFDVMGFEYLYEHEGFDLDSAGYYLPDFYLPHVDMWAEVKPKEFTTEEYEKLKGLALFTQRPALMLVGVPDRKAYEALHACTHNKETDIVTYEYILSNYHDYYRDEHRFYGAPAEDEVYWTEFDDVMDGILAAKSARF